ncbi:MAG: hypothetical protein Pg6A_06640 [Termitinemataceae bacterium]|nr:MAG: hypothetical protein Pg6A_06640 [Termitinemataceae bacterium]
MPVVFVCKIMKLHLCFFIITFIFLPQINLKSEETAVRSILDLRTKELLELLKENKIEYEERPLKRGYGAWGTSVFVWPQGTDDENFDSLVVIAIPITAPNDSGQTTHSGFAAALKFLTDVRPFTAPVLFAFLADEWELQSEALSYSGLRDLLDALRYSENCEILYLNTVEMPSVLNIVQAAYNNVASLNMLKSWTDSCEALAIPFRILSRYNILYKKKLIQVAAPPGIAGEYEIPLLYISGGTGKIEETKIDSGALGSALNSWITKNALALPDNSVLNYYITGLDSLPVYLNETRIIIISFLFVMLLFLFALFMRYAKSHTKILFIVLGSFFSLLFFIVSLVDIALIPIVLPSLFILSLLMILQAINKKYKIIKRHYAFFSSAAIIICVISALIPFVNIIKDAVRLKAESYDWNLPELTSAAAEGKTDFFDAAISEQQLLERRIIKLSISSAKEALLYHVIFKPEQDSSRRLFLGEHKIPPFIYAAPVPWFVNENTLELSMGAFPPKELSLEIALPAELRGEFIVEAFWQNASERRILR